MVTYQCIEYSPGHFGGVGVGLLTFSLTKLSKGGGGVDISTFVPESKNLKVLF